MNDPRAAQAERKWPASPAKAQPLKVLLVEDSAILRVRIESMIAQHEGLEVAGVAAGEEEALAKLAATDFDAIILDVELRPGSGISVIRHARARDRIDAKSHNACIVVFTNYGLPAVRERCLQAGADFFLDKMREFHRLVPILLHECHQRGAEPH